PEFDKRNTKIIGLSADPVSDHERWLGDIKETQGYAVNYPLIGDPELTVAKLYDMIHPNATGGKRTAAENATVRSVFVVGPDKKVKAMIVYPMSTGRNFDEVLRLLDSVKLTARHKSDYPKLPNEDRVMDALRPLAIPPGDYMMPRPSSREEMRTPQFVEKLKKGPVLMLTVWPGGSMSMGKQLVQWFVYAVVVG